MRPRPEPKIGDKMPDGTIYAGISPETNKPMYATPTDAPLTCTFNEARGYAFSLDAHGHNDWRMPTKAELTVLFNNRADIGGFNLTGPGTAAWYWYDGRDWEALRFTDGYRDDPSMEDGCSSLRCIRDITPAEEDEIANQRLADQRQRLADQEQRQSAAETQKLLRQKANQKRPPGSRSHSEKRNRP